MNSITFGRKRVKDRSANIALGESDFGKIITNNKLYVDKTYLIADLIDYGWSTACITRPRRFGKTLNISMLKYFFEDVRNDKGYKSESNAKLFKGLYIESTELFNSYQGQYPVIYLNLSNCQGENWEECLLSIKKIISLEFLRHKYAFKNNKYTQDFERFIDISNIDNSLWAISLKILSDALYEYHKTACIVLIDEYDAILNQAYSKVYGDTAREFVKRLMQSVTKDNPSTKLSVITGCLPLTENSVFTGFNHVVSCDVTSPLLNDCCGLTDTEVETLVNKYHLDKCIDIIREWYSGYNIGGINIYNSWEIFNFIEKYINNHVSTPKSYWMTSSENLVLKRFIENLNIVSIQDLINLLIAGDTITEDIMLNISYSDLITNSSYIWTLLLLTGFLTACETDISNTYNLYIPNKSVLSCFKYMVNKSLNTSNIKIDFAEELDKCFIRDDVKSIKDSINNFLLEYISFHDTISENSYHMLILGILSTLSAKYRIHSNREVGYGRCDIILESKRETDNTVVILEFKYQDIDDNKLYHLAQKGYKQIIDQGYNKVYQLNKKHIHCFGIAFNKKKCEVANTES